MLFDLVVDGFVIALELPAGFVMDAVDPALLSCFDGCRLRPVICREAAATDSASSGTDFCDFCFVATTAVSGGVACSGTRVGGLLTGLSAAVDVGAEMPQSGVSGGISGLPSTSLNRWSSGIPPR